MEGQNPFTVICTLLHQFFCVNELQYMLGKMYNLLRKSR